MEHFVNSKKSITFAADFAFGDTMPARNHVKLIINFARLGSGSGKPQWIIDS